MKEKCYYHYIIKDTIKPPLSQERWEVFSLFFKKSPPKEQAFVRLSHPDRGKGPAHRTPGRGRRWTPILRQKGESPCSLPLSSPSMSARLTLGVGRLLKGIHPPFRPIACPGKAAGPGSSPQKPEGPNQPFRPTDSPGRAAGPGGSPQKDPKGPTNLSAQRTRPVGHASQSSAGRSRRKRMQSCFDRLRRPKHSSQPPVCPQGARSGCIPQFWEGPPTKQNIRHPRTLPSRTKLSPRLPLPKFPS